MGEVARASLMGKRIVIARAAEQSDRLAEELRALGAIPVTIPLVAFADPEDFSALDGALALVERFDWVIFTSGQAVRAVVARCESLKVSLSSAGKKPMFAAVGPVSAKSVERAGLRVEYVAKRHTGVALAEELGERLRGRSVLLPRSDRANPDLPAALAKFGAQVTEVIAYRTLQPTDVDMNSLGRIAAGEADAILFFSPSAVQHFAALAGAGYLRGLQDKLAITAVGPVTASALREAGAERIVVATETAAPGVIQALEMYFAGTTKESAGGVKQG